MFPNANVPLLKGVIWGLGLCMNKEAVNRGKRIELRDTELNVGCCCCLCLHSSELSYSCILEFSIMLTS